jgi:hypothetical protein
MNFFDNVLKRIQLSYHTWGQFLNACCFIDKNFAGTNRQNSTKITTIDTVKHLAPEKGAKNTVHFKMFS